MQSILRGNEEACTRIDDNEASFDIVRGNVSSFQSFFDHIRDEGVVQFILYNNLGAYAPQFTGKGGNSALHL